MFKEQNVKKKNVWKQNEFFVLSNESSTVNKSGIPKLRKCSPVTYPAQKNINAMRPENTQAVSHKHFFGKRTLMLYSGLQKHLAWAYLVQVTGLHLVSFDIQVFLPSSFHWTLRNNSFVFKQFVLDILLIEHVQILYPYLKHLF